MKGRCYWCNKVTDIFDYVEEDFKAFYCTERCREELVYQRDLIRSDRDKALYEEEE